MAFLFELFEGDIIASIHKLEVAHQSDLSGFNPVSFKPGAGWKEIPFSEEGGDLKLAVNSTMHGIIFKYSSSVSILKMSPEVSAAILPYLDKNSVVRITDMNGEVYILGSRDTPVAISLEGTSGSAFTARSGYTIQAYIEQTWQALKE